MWFPFPFVLLAVLLATLLGCAGPSLRRVAGSGADDPAPSPPGARAPRPEAALGQPARIGRWQVYVPPAEEDPPDEAHPVPGHEHHPAPEPGSGE